MEQLESIIYRFSAFACNEDGIRDDFSVAVSAPEFSGEGDSFCLMSCPFLRAKPFTIYGVDHEQALELSLRFVEISLGHMNAHLVDGDGNDVQLPPPPALDR
ncbi:MAG: hypothetical protein QGH73_00745 [Rhodospirillales bacterium]|nr:hypothetical protein [Rhodospirillales bacterium]MDP6642672.1 hypothetical protein [Rhodospirillales bacterium]MDP6840185.1 hypothetical protein [Rhodospirillales bacterium]